MTRNLLVRLNDLVKTGLCRIDEDKEYLRGNTPDLMDEGGRLFGVQVEEYTPEQLKIREQLKEQGMLKLVVDNEREEDQAAPHLQTGGKGPPKSWDWLSGMSAGTVFLARPKTGPNTWIIYEFGHGGIHAGNNALLIPNRMYDQPTNWFWCDPAEFSKVYELRGILEDE